MYDELSKNWEMKAEKVLPMELYQQVSNFVYFYARFARRNKLVVSCNIQ
jgi:hypothetical protein